MGFGAELRSERERRGVSMETLCAETKLNRRHIEALEAEDYAALPGGVFRRGIARACMASLGLAEGVWLPRFDRSYADHERSHGIDPAQRDEGWAAFAENVKRNRTAPQPRHALRWLGVVAMVLALAAAGWAVWHFVLQARPGR